MNLTIIFGVILLVLVWVGIIAFFKRGDNKFKRRMRGFGHLMGAFGIGLLIFVLLYGISWIVTCGIIKLITLCFGWQFKWSVATGIWLVICILKSIFSHHTTVNTK